MTNNESKGPFEGLLVIDMTHVLNGPFGTQLLCNMGARVIKVEPPGHGDDTRTFGPYVDGQSLYYLSLIHIYWHLSTFDNIIYKHYSQNLIKFQLHPA
ncbi:CoA-transferase, NAD(P)-binding [Escherichia coli]|nr:CoA-transferase, NAD(P)-binding [Escherichia coli]